MALDGGGGGAAAAAAAGGGAGDAAVGGDGGGASGSQSRTLAKGRDGTGLDLGQLLRHAQHALAQPDLQVLGKVADGLGQGVRYGAENIRYDDINSVLVELIVHLVRE